MLGKMKLKLSIFIALLVPVIFILDCGGNVRIKEIKKPIATNIPWVKPIEPSVDIIVDFYLVEEQHKSNRNVSNLISDFQFTNQQFDYDHVYEFFKLFPETELKEKDQHYIYQMCRRYNLNFIAIACKLEQESSTVTGRSKFDPPLRYRRALGYACYIKKTNEQGVEYRPYEGINNQIYHGTRVLRKHFDTFDKQRTLKVKSVEKVITCYNASTLALYRYTPFYGEAVAFGHNTVGNRRFMAIWKYFYPKWVEIINEGKVFTNNKL